MKIEVLYFVGCPNHEAAVERIRQLLREEGVSAEVQEVDVSDASIAQKLEFQGSPTIRVNGLDVEPDARGPRVRDDVPYLRRERPERRAAIARNDAPGNPGSESRR